MGIINTEQDTVLPIVQWAKLKLFSVLWLDLGLVLQFQNWIENLMVTIICSSLVQNFLIRKVEIYFSCVKINVGNWCLTVNLSLLYPIELHHTSLFASIYIYIYINISLLFCLFCYCLVYDQWNGWIFLNTKVQILLV